MKQVRFPETVISQGIHFDCVVKLSIMAATVLSHLKFPSNFWSFLELAQDMSRFVELTQAPHFLNHSPEFCLVFQGFSMSLKCITAL